VLPKPPKVLRPAYSMHNSQQVTPNKKVRLTKRTTVKAEGKHTQGDAAQQAPNIGGWVSHSVR
jgi:hypothetical protein